MKNDGARCVVSALLVSKTRIEAFNGERYEREVEGRRSRASTKGAVENDGQFGGTGSVEAENVGGCLSFPV